MPDSLGLSRADPFERRTLTAARLQTAIASTVRDRRSACRDWPERVDLDVDLQHAVTFGAALRVPAIQSGHVMIQKCVDGSIT